MKRTYNAEVTRDGRFWFVRVPEINRSTQALRYADVETMACELIEIMDGLTREDYDLHLVVKLPSEIQEHLARAEMLREEAARKQSEAASESRAAVQKLLSKGISQREAGKVLGLSFQRVSQLAKP
ncbi:hypothetical protein D5S17_18485 [Pseudonocardiaceae bacterium YIM PH 21723]|nr:hypothetical protein D5S17_18485 [Pseudonocardiaceae bacterium YIM PH 21723]